MHDAEAVDAQYEAVWALCTLAAVEDLAQPILGAALPALASLLQHGHPEGRAAVAAALSKLTSSAWGAAADAVLPGLVALIEVSSSRALKDALSVAVPIHAHP